MSKVEFSKDESGNIAVVFNDVKFLVTPIDDVIVYSPEASKIFVEQSRNEQVEGFSCNWNLDAVAVGRARIRKHREVFVVSTPGETLIRPPPAATAIAEAKKAVEVGQKMADGTICFKVKGDEAWFVAAQIFADEKYSWGEQGEAAKTFNKQNKHGHSDWEEATDEDTKDLCVKETWQKVAPYRAIKTTSAPSVWSPASGSFNGGIVRRPGFAGKVNRDPVEPLHVVPVRRGPALV